MTPKAQAIKEKDRLDFIKITNCSTSKDTFKKAKKLVSDGSHL
jgi:hypothetical protein